MTAAANIPTDLAPWTVHPEHVRAALNIDGLTIGTTAVGEVLVDTETRLTAAGADAIAYPERLVELFTEHGLDETTAVLNRSIALVRTSRRWAA